jgi:hypothetical protein
MRQACIELAERAGIDPDELLEWWAERAAVREFDGGQPREEAERNALEDVRTLIEIGPWVLGARKGPRPADPSCAGSGDAERHKPNA